MATNIRLIAKEPSVRIETVFIKGVSFTMGTPIRNTWDSEYHKDERRLKVTVADFRIGKYPVTAEQMCVFLNSPEGANHDGETLYNHRDLGDKGLGYYRYSTIALGDDGRYTPREDAANAPANQVTWKGAALFCIWLSEKTGKRYRLPAEAEWELAARGIEGRPWPWGTASPTEAHGFRYDYDVLAYNSAVLADRMSRNQPTWTTAPVGSYPANATPDGVHDMLAYLIGEWTTNKYVERATPEQMVNPELDVEDVTTHRVVRGYYHRPRGGFRLPFPFGTASYHGGRTWTRVHSHPITAVKHAARHGFRVVEEVPFTSSSPTAKPTVPQRSERTWLLLGMLLLSFAVIIGLFSGYAWRMRRPAYRTD